MQNDGVAAVSFQEWQNPQERCIAQHELLHRFVLRFCLPSSLCCFSLCTQDEVLVELIKRTNGSVIANDLKTQIAVRGGNHPHGLKAAVQ